MRYFDIREFLELTIATLLGGAAAWVVLVYRPHWVPPVDAGAWLLLGGVVGLLLGVIYSAWRVDRRVDYRIPPHLRKPPSPAEGRPIGVLAWRTRDAASEYLWLLLGVLVVLVVLWLARTFVL